MKGQQVTVQEHAHIFHITERPRSKHFCGLVKHPLRKHWKRKGGKLPSADIRVCTNITDQKESMNCFTEMNISWKGWLAFLVHRLPPHSCWGSVVYDLQPGKFRPRNPVTPPQWQTTDMPEKGSRTQAFWLFCFLTIFYWRSAASPSLKCYFNKMKRTPRAV